MNLLNRIRKVELPRIPFFSAGINTHIKSTDYSKITGTLINPPDFETFAEMYKLYTFVSTPVNRVVAECVSLKPIIKNEEGKEISIEDDEYISFYSSAWWTTFYTHLLVFGQAVMVKNRDGFYYLLPSSKLDFWKAEGLEIVEFIYKFENYNITITKKDNFVIVKYKTFESHFFGLSPLTALYDDIRKIFLDNKNMIEDYERGARLGLTVILPQGAQKQDMENAKQTLIESAQEGNKSYGHVFPHGTEIKIFDQGLLQSLPQDEKIRIERMASNVFGYPYQFLAESSTSLGQGEQKTFRIVLQATIKVLQNSSRNIWDILLKEANIEYKKLEFEEYKIDSDAETMKSVETLVNAGILTRREAKIKYLGYDENEINKNDDIAYIPSNVTLDTKPETPELEKGTIVETPKSDTQSLDTIDVKKSVQLYPITPRVREHAKKYFQKNLRGLWDKETVPLSDEVINSKKADMFKSILADKLEEDVHMKSTDLTELLQFSALVAVQDVINEYMLAFGEMPSEDVLVQIYEAVGQYAELRNNTLTSDEERNDVIVPLLADIEIILANNLAHTADKQLQYYLENGLTLEQAKDKLADKTKDRANFIVEIETRKAVGVGFAVASQAMKAKKQWLLTKSKFPRVGKNNELIHIELVGKVVNSDEFFVCSDGSRDFTSGQRFGCKCGCRPVFKN